MNLKQYKLTTNDEIICELVEETQEGLVIRKALRVIATDDYDTNIRYYQFRPWISFQDDFDDLSILRTSHIVGETTPSNVLVTHFTSAVKEVDDTMKFNKEFDIEELINGLEDFNEEEVEALIKQKMLEKEFMQDSSDSNIIHFKPGTKH
jgi:hypothetical protein